MEVWSNDSLGRRETGAVDDEEQDSVSRQTTGERSTSKQKRRRDIREFNNSAPYAKLNRIFIYVNNV